MSSISVQCGHVTRQLLKNGGRLTGTVKEFALGVIGDPIGESENAKFCRGMADKLKADQPLSDYEQHFLVDVLLLHERLGTR
jgi:hypothetical protein